MKVLKLGTTSLLLRATLAQLADASGRIVDLMNENGHYLYKREEPKLGVIICVETAQPGDRATDSDIVIPECNTCSQRVNHMSWSVFSFKLRYIVGF